MSEPVAPAARKTAEQADSGLAKAADGSVRHGFAARPGVALAAVFVVVLLVGVAAALAWRAPERNPAWGAVGVAAAVLLGGLALWLVRRLVDDSRAGNRRRSAPLPNACVAATSPERCARCVPSPPARFRFGAS